MHTDNRHVQSALRALAVFIFSVVAAAHGMGADEYAVVGMPQVVDAIPEGGSTNPSDYILVTSPNGGTAKPLGRATAISSGSKVETMANTYVDLRYVHRIPLGNGVYGELETTVRLLPGSKALFTGEGANQGEVELLSGALVVDETYSTKWATNVTRPKFHTKTKPTTLAGAGTTYGVFLSGSTVRFTVGTGKVCASHSTGEKVFDSPTTRSITVGGDFATVNPTPYEINVTPGYPIPNSGGNAAGGS